MRKKMIVSFMLIALVSALVGGATFAIFTDDATNTNNTFSAGTVDILLNNDNDDEITSFTVADMAPGDTETQSIEVKNYGTLELRYDVTLATSGALFEGLNPIALTFKIDGVDFTPGDNNFVLAPGATNTIEVTAAFPSAAGNEYQGATGSFDLTFNAEQTKNN